MRARQQPVVDRQLVGEVAALGHLDGIDLADEVGDRDVRRGQLLAVAAIAGHPHDAGRLALSNYAAGGSLADRRAADRR
jgi:hypothetical protein